MLILGGISIIGAPAMAVEELLNDDCLDVVHEVMDSDNPEDFLSDEELVCFGNWLYAECKGYEVTPEDYESCLD